MNGELYYKAYDKRYRTVHEAGIDFWGHTPNDEVLFNSLKEWVINNDLAGKRIIEFACGEGAAGVMLSKLGCIYHGIDISAAAVEKARNTLNGYEHATVSQLDMVNDKITDTYDAALDSSGFHMLVLDCDRQAYLANVFACLRIGAPMLFYQEAYRTDAYEGTYESMEQWLEMTGVDIDTPEQRFGRNGDEEIEIFIPLLPARPKSKKGYITEMESVGFVVDELIENESNESITYSATIKVHKP